MSVDAVHEPIPVGKFAAHVEQMHLNENCGFGEEYKVREVIFTDMYIHIPYS